MKNLSKFLKIVFFLVSFTSLAQVPGMKNFNISNGLPSDEVYKSLMDSKGYLWFATNSGVCYFNGSDFVTLDMNDGLIENTILEIEEDQDGRVWFLGISGSLCYFENGTIHPYMHNNLIRKIKKPGELVGSGCFFPVNRDDVQFIYNHGRKIHIKKGRVDIHDVNKGDSVILTRASDEYQFYIKFNKHKKRIYFYARFDNNNTVSIKHDFNEDWSSVINYNFYQEFEDRIIFLSRQNAYVFHKNGHVDFISLKIKPVYSIKGVYGGIWIGTEKDGLMFFGDLNLEKKSSTHFLDGKYITSLAYDQNNRGWVTTLTDGIFHVQSLDVINYFKPFSEDNHVTNIVELNDGSFAAFSNKGYVFLLDKHFQKLKIQYIKEINKELVYQVKTYKDYIFIATSNNFFKVHQDYFKTNISSKIDPLHKSNIKDFVIQDSIIWVATSNGLYHFPEYLKNGSKTCIKPDKKLDSRVSKIIKYHPVNYDERYSYLICQGIDNVFRMRYLKSDPSFVQLSNYEVKYGQKELVTAANDIFIHGDTIFLATKGRGLVCITPDTLCNINKNDGLSSNFIKRMGITQDGRYIIGTNKGVNIINLKSDSFCEIDSLNLLTVQDGLIGNDIHDFVVKDNLLLCATNNGLSLINIPVVTGMKDKYPIYIVDFKVNEKDIFADSINFYSLKANENNISISFDALDFHDKKGLTYHYKISGSADNSWKKVKDSKILFPIMSSGEYTFNVKAVNSYGYWSENTASITFKIAKVFYKTWFFRISFIVLITMLLYFLFKNIYSRRNQLLRTEKLLVEYQQQSLTRVINPHFLMNIFNSINSNLFNKRPAVAMAYVKDVGDLVKLIFNSSYYNKITILEEVKLLKSYISIEKRRSPYGFKEVIKYSDSIKDYFIPSLMIQIFAENAIHHGFSDFKRKAALLSIVFKDQDPYIICEITDNGMGIKESKKLEKAESHKPRKHGIDIIKERLELLNHNLDFKYELFVQEIHSNISGKVIGTKVELWFPKQAMNQGD